MKIGLVLDDTLDKPDGVQAAVLDIGAELSSRGHDVHYLVTETNRTDIKNIHSMSSYVSLHFNGNTVRTPKPVNKNRVRELLNKLELDVIHVQMPYSPLMAGRVIDCAPPKTKIFGTFHILPYDSLTTMGTKILGWYLHKNLKKFDGFFAVSKPAQDFMLSSFGVDGTVMPNPIDYRYFSSFEKQKNKKQTIVFVGRFDKRKGVEYLVRAYAELPKKVQAQTDVIMCGKGPLLEEMQNLAKKLNVSIHFPGFVSNDHKAQYLANSDIAVFPSISGESFGIVLVEAMASRAGITLAGDNPGYSSVLRDFPETLFNPTDINQFTRIISKYLQNPQVREKIGNAQHMYSKKFDIALVVDKLLEEYSKV